MARRADWDNDDDYRQVKTIISYHKRHFICNISNVIILENDTFEILPCKNKPSSLTNTNPLPPVTIIDIPISTPIEITEGKQSLENSSPPSTSSNCLPTRYGSAAIIPHDDGFDLKSILSSRPSLSNQTNDILNYLQHEKTKKRVYTVDDNLHQLLIDNGQDRQSLVQVARQAQEDFMNAIHLD
jgi:hypothetical protein